jgi:hypothetical protein
MSQDAGAPVVSPGGVQRQHFCSWIHMEPALCAPGLSLALREPVLPLPQCSLVVSRVCIYDFYSTTPGESGILTESKVDFADAANHVSTPKRAKPSPPKYAKSMFIQAKLSCTDSMVATKLMKQDCCWTVDVVDPSLTRTLCGKPKCLGLGERFLSAS